MRRMNSGAQLGYTLARTLRGWCSLLSGERTAPAQVTEQALTLHPITTVHARRWAGGRGRTPHVCAPE